MPNLPVQDFKDYQESLRTYADELDTYISENEVDGFIDTGSHPIPPPPPPPGTS